MLPTLAIAQKGLLHFPRFCFFFLPSSHFETVSTEWELTGGG